ncbi:uncharacterized protein BX663DRAFT_440083 [Cokeromyces recurvatus]|uniref:uncharacterized protein n=1 Tax=Cokeromyces recurvatus TaxID=90255 RepID=UPI0022206D36|nr:uncharacterized protein BX663DRAFT_440083 [Cokeromyces recurvatus]KAI7900046.1 hypothetical protein BX663DRAFT_440083 [Cokeromyces recurvatus]
MTEHQYQEIEQQRDSNRLQQQNEDLPMDLGSLQDIFTFQFIEGRPITNFILAILWSIGLPILLYHLLKHHLGQVLAMIIASCPPLIIVVSRMIKTKTMDVLGFVAGISFLISGIISIAQPSPQVSTVCESIVPLLVGIFCLLSLFPIKMGSFQLRPLIFQVANQIMPRTAESEELETIDQERTQQQSTSSSTTDKQSRLNWIYNHMSKFRTDLRILTACWGITLIIGFIIKVIITYTNADITAAQNFGYIFFSLATVALTVFSWLFTKIMKRHVKEQAGEMQQQKHYENEGYDNIQWGIQAMSNEFNQIVY